MTDALKSQATEWLDAEVQNQIDFLAELVKIPSDNPPGDVAPHAAKTAELLEALGFEVERHVVPQELVEANGMVSATNLIIRATFGDGAGPVIALNSHGDVVAPGEGWDYDPYGAEIDQGVMYGRGVAVSKSDFATYAYALLALKQLGADSGLNGTVELHLTYDEEAGGAIGPKWILSEGLSKPDYALSAAFSYAVVTHHNGCLHMEAKILGKSAHAAAPETGHDALEAASHVLNGLYAHRHGLASKESAVEGIGSPSLVVGLIEGGINTNVVPDKVTLRIDRRLIPEEDAGEVERELAELIAASVAKMPGIDVVIRRIMLAVPFRPVEGAAELAEVIRKNAEAEIGEEVPLKGVPIYTDARHYSEAGVATVLYGAGPRSILEANGHRANECLVLEDLRKATRVVAASLVDLLS